MCIKTIETFMIYAVMYVLAFDEIYVNGQPSQEMVEQGRLQYQLLKEKGNLPQYGTCWKSAVEQVDHGCKHLSEETQSVIALYLTNCFLTMSGHDTYNCELDMKPNLRAICINSMSDRAFNVYTEFYTHTQNICWFLRGQLWHETISENTFKVGKQLEVSTKTQERLLEAQKESMEMQEKILLHGRMLEGVLEELYVSTKAHQEILRVLTKSLGHFQAWVVGEVSWFDTVLFYLVSGIFTVVFTATERTASGRLPILICLLSNLMVERFVCFWLISEDSLLNTDLLYQDIRWYVWLCRYFFVSIAVFYFVYSALRYKNLLVENGKVLKKIVDQNDKILDALVEMKSKNRLSTLNVDLLDESSFNQFNGLNQSEHYNNNTYYSDFMKSKRNGTLKPHCYNQYYLRSKTNTPDRS